MHASTAQLNEQKNNNFNKIKYVLRNSDNNRKGRKFCLIDFFCAGKTPRNICVCFIRITEHLLIGLHL